MLKTLQIRNYALIKDLEMDPSSGLNMITGETGAGKSIMLGAVGLLMGNRADTKILLSQEEKCLVEGVFEITRYARIKDLFVHHDIEYEAETIIRREISPSGKSRAFINDQPVTLEVLKSIGARLIDIHSQHETLLLGSNQFQLRLIDLFAETSETLKTYQQAFGIYSSMLREYEELKANAADLAKDHDYNSFLLQELTDARIDDEDQERLEQDLNTMENSGEIKSALGEVFGLLDGSDFSAINHLNQSRGLIAKLSQFSQKYENLSERLESCLIELKDIASEIESEEETIEHDAEVIEELKGKLSLIYRLQQKHQVGSIEELVKIKQDLEKSVGQSSNLDEELEKRGRELEKVHQKMMAAGQQLSEQRQAIFKGLQNKVSELLIGVGIAEATIAISQKEVEPNITGIDQVDILFSANKGVPPQEIKHVASGGEFSRLMFCLKYLLANKTHLPTVIFDEIDTGVSGEIAIKMVTMMKRMAQNHQIISISHLPQFAAQGDAHYYVFKDNSEARSVSKIKKLEGEERLLEIAKMIGGDTPSETAVSSARELMDH